MNNYIYHQEYNRPLDDSLTIPIPSIILVTKTAEPFRDSLNREVVRAIASKNNKADSSLLGNTDVSLEYLKNFCKEVSEQEAQIIHPNLFKYLEEHELSLCLTLARKSINLMAY